MLRLIADSNLNSERGRKGGQKRQKRRARDRTRGEKMGTLRQRNLFVKNAPLTQEEDLKSAESGKMVVGRGRKEGGE